MVVQVEAVPSASAPGSAHEIAVNRLERPRGRSLAWVELGEPAGRPVLYCHGFPSCGREARFADAAAQAARVRLIAPDRPGMADSSPQPGRRIRDWPAEAQALRAHLGLTTMPVLGLSGGAPYALACAALAPAHFGPVACVGGLGPLADADDARSMSAVSRLAIRLARRRSRLQAAMFHTLGAVVRHQPKILFSLLAGTAPPADRTVFHDREVRGTWQAAMRHAMANGAGGAIDELRLYVQPWGVPLERIETSVTLWHGDRDTVVPERHAERLQALIPAARLHRCPDEGHFSLPIRRIETVLNHLQA